jgi:hypothetical protein
MKLSDFRDVTWNIDAARIRELAQENSYLKIKWLDMDALEDEILDELSAVEDDAIEMALDQMQQYQEEEEEEENDAS